MAGMRRVQLVIIDDQGETRTTLAEFLAETQGVEVVGTAGDQILACDLVRDVQPDLIVLDLDFIRGMSGVELLPELVRQCPTAKLVALSGHGTDHEAAALEAGAYVFFLKESMREVVESIRAVIDDMHEGSA
jgi:two-component system, chemotaxis family, protein-glutamate methylesterase/glutaminase